MWRVGDNGAERVNVTFRFFSLFFVLSMEERGFCVKGGGGARVKNCVFERQRFKWMVSAGCVERFLVNEGWGGGSR